ncbi:MAG: hypothetical protein K2X50_10150 [Gammaproteobacteria bacterium]|nr:hypothetical protein [Gammaproteobacteria bacterium]
MKRFFSTVNSRPGSLMGLGSLSDLENLPISFRVVTWPPSRKIMVNRFLRIYDRVPLTADEVKLALRESQDENTRIDPYGHSAAELRVNLQHPELNDQLRIRIQDQAKLSKKEMSCISSLYAYVSWYPDRNSSTGRLLNLRERLLLIKSPEHLNTDALKKDLLDILTSEYKATCNPYNADEKQYGEPLPERILTFTSLDFISITDTLFKMMKYQVSNARLVMNQASDLGTYYGIDMLVRNILHSLAQHEKIDLPVHVCTTAVLRLLKDGVGNDLYTRAVDEVINSNPKLSHGIPLVDTVHYLAKEIHNLSELSNAPSHKF